MKKTIAIVSVLVVVFLCSSFPVFADTLSGEENYSAGTNWLDNLIRVQTNALVNRPYLVNYDYDFISERAYYGTTNQPYPANPYNWNSSAQTFFYDVPVTITVTVLNRGDALAYSPGTAMYSFTPNISFVESPYCWYVECTDPDVSLYGITPSGQFRFSVKNDHYSYLGNLAIQRSGTWTFQFTIHFLYYYDLGSLNGTTYPQILGTSFDQYKNYISINSITIVSPTEWVWSNVDAYADQNITLWQIKERVSSIYNHLFNRDTSYSDVSSESSSLDSSSSAATTQSDTNHQTELSYFNQTNTALNNTGISNYSFNNEQIGGIGSVSNDFTSVWNSLGSWTSVYIFSLTLSLGLAIIRHVRPIQRSKQE